MVKVGALSVCLAAVAAVLTVWVLAPMGSLRNVPHLPWPALVPAFLATELATVRVTVFRQSFAFTVAELPLVVGLLLVRPAGTVVAWVVAAAVAEFVISRRPPTKAGFNLAKVSLQAAAAAVVFRAVLGPHWALGPWGWLAAMLAVVVAGLLSTVAVLGVISLANGRLPRPLPVGDMAMVLVAAVAGACLALVGVILAQTDLSALSLLVAAGVLVFLVLRSYAMLSKRHHSLQALYEFTRGVNEAADATRRVGAILSGTRDILQVDRTSLTLVDPDGGVVIWTLNAEAEPTVRHRAEAGAIAEEVLHTGEAVAVSRSGASAEHRRALEEAGVGSAALVPLRGRDGVFGVLAVANQAKALRRQERELFAALAGHAQVSIDNERLVDRLRQEVEERAHEATHDALTGLANRTLLEARMSEALAREGQEAAFLLIDLDRFKEVNDTLGHRAGDQLLCQAAARLTGLVGGNGLVARLGGDEFGVLVLGAGDRAGALGLAQELARTLQAVYRLGEVTVEVAASVGVVVAPADGTDPATLLQRADVAMYQSKAEGARAFAYDPAQDHHSPRRLALSAQLRRAIEAGDLDVAFQPVAALADGAIIGAEALVRWTHPRLGEVSAKEVVSTAERTGAIWPLTALVLTRALEWRAGWARRGRDLDVQVNVSARTLVDADLGAKVGELLARTGVPASALTLEITESSLVADVPRSGEILQRLRDVGVSVAIDDFGVGHASLAYLRRLPCDALKIDRSFVQGMTSDRSDQIIVSSTVVLAHSLGLRVVAEGVADVGAWARLRALGCDAAQGHFLAPALTPEAMEAWLWEWEARCEDARRWAGPGALRHPLPPRPVARPSPPASGAPEAPSAGIVRSGGDPA